LSDSKPIWIQKWFKKIVVEIIKHAKTRFEVISKMLKEAFNEPDNGNFNAEIDLKYTHGLRKHSHEYAGHVRAAVLAKLLDKDKGDLVYCYDTFTEEYIVSKKCWKRKKSYSDKPENLNLEEYKNHLFKKLKDTLEITGFNIDHLKQQVLSKHTAAIPISREVGIF
jgi:DNA polymerase, archaea type